jgi:hypothetical protein
MNQQYPTIMTEALRVSNYLAPILRRGPMMVDHRIMFQDPWLAECVRFVKTLIETEAEEHNNDNNHPTIMISHPRSGNLRIRKGANVPLFNFRQLSLPFSISFRRQGQHCYLSRRSVPSPALTTARRRFWRSKQVFFDCHLAFHK